MTYHFNSNAVRYEFLESGYLQRIIGKIKALRFEDYQKILHNAAKRLGSIVMKKIAGKTKIELALEGLALAAIYHLFGSWAVIFARSSIKLAKYYARGTEFEYYYREIMEQVQENICKIVEYIEDVIATTAESFQLMKYQVRQYATNINTGYRPECI